jgi:myo-inositol 2-dehydrogenase/D-chiro-inositol 1-dehydrogenase
MATHSGQRVTWEEAFNSNRVLAPESYAWDADPPVLPGPDGQYPHPIPGTTKVL